jgi:hypothetical protein
MADLIVSGRTVGQPRRNVPLDHAHWAYDDIVFAYSSGRSFQEGKFRVPGLVTGSMTPGSGPKGKYVIPFDASSYIGFSDRPGYNTLAEVTVIALIRTGGFTVQQGIVTKCETGGGSNTPFGLFTEVSGYISLNRSHGGGGTPFRVWQSAATLTTGLPYVIAVTQGADISVSPKFYINGAFDSGATSSLYGGAGTGAPTTNTTSVKVGNRTDLATQCFHEIYDVLILKRELPASEISLLTNSMYAHWKASPRKISYSVASASFKSAWARNSNVMIGAHR